VVRAHARVRNGHYKLSVHLPAGQRDTSGSEHRERGGDKWTYRLAYAGNQQLLPATASATFNLEDEPRWTQGDEASTGAVTASPGRRD
jgi:hypothetical protein